MRTKEQGNGAVWTIVILALIGLCIWWGVSSHNAWVQRTSETISIKVKEKDRVWNNDKDQDQYLIFTENEVFENTDNMYYQKYNSSDVYGQLEVGKTYKCLVFGERDPYWSRYRNIVSCEAEK